MGRKTYIIAAILLFLPSISEGSPNVTKRQARADKPGVSRIAKGKSVSFDDDGEWYYFAGFKSRSGCDDGFETITIFQYNTEKIIRVKPGVYSVWTRIIKCAECSFSVGEKSFTGDDEAGRWYGVIYDDKDLGINLEKHLVACSEDVVDESFDGFLQRAICADRGK